MTEREVETERAAMELLEEALERPTADQIAYIESRLDVPETVRRQALALLSSDRDEPVSIQTGGAGHSLADASAVPPELAGYRIVRQLGRGESGGQAEAGQDRGQRLVRLGHLRAGDPEVDQLGLTGRGHQHGVRRQVAVDDQVLVRELDRLSDLAEHRQPARPRVLPAPRPAPGTCAHRD